MTPVQLPARARRRPRAPGRRFERWIENRPPRGFWPRLDPRELWDYRDVGLILAQRDVKVRYKQTFFGVAWAVLQPLMAMGIFVLVLGKYTSVPSDGVPYSVFVLAGLAVWFPFSTAVISASESLVGDPELVTKVYFPRLLAPLGAVLVSVIDLAVSLAITVAVAIAAGVGPRPALVLLPLCAPAVLLLSLAFGLWLSALNVLYRDVRHAMGFGIQLLFFSSPIVYPSSLVGGWLGDLLALNPLVGAVDAVRWVILGTPAPFSHLLISLGSTGVLLATGLVFFRRAERQFADRI